MDGFKPLEEYGVIGNLETCALVSTDGSIDWCCLPYIYSPSVFAGLLDTERGGTFAIHPAGEYESSQQYMEQTNVLQTTFRTQEGTATVTDFMPVVEENTREQPEVRALYRKVTCTDGAVDLEVEFDPQLDYARASTTLDPVSDGVVATGENRRITLSSPTDLETGDDDEPARGTLHLEAHDSSWFVLQYSMHVPLDSEECEGLLDDTIGYWRDWAHTCEESDCVFGGVAHDLVVRSELVLKLLNYRETGAIYAAPTTSLPEDIGGVRNWDYRFSWIRDGAITVRAMTNLDHVEEAKEYAHRFLERSRAGDSVELQPLYGVEGDVDLDEEELPHFSGYEGSSPVRIGNEAAEQQQLDVYGNLVLALYQRSWTDEQSVVEEDWLSIQETVGYVCDHWEDRGAGIWELRGDPDQHVHSKVMCWAAVDRAIQLADREDLEAPLEKWRGCREEIKAAILERGFNEELNSFTQTFDGDALDATGLMLVLSGILPFDDPRIVGTVEAIQEHLATEEGLVYRYKIDDGLEGEEGTFVLCSFWLVNALVAIGRVEEAWDVFENVCEHASPLGLLAEEIDPETGRLLGNFPQGFSHIGLINSALYLREAEYEWADVEPLGAPTLVQEDDERA